MHVISVFAKYDKTKDVLRYQTRCHVQAKPYSTLLVILINSEAKYIFIHSISVGRNKGQKKWWNWNVKATVCQSCWEKWKSFTELKYQPLNIVMNVKYAPEMCNANTLYIIYNNKSSGVTCPQNGCIWYTIVTHFWHIYILMVTLFCSVILVS